jgi:integrase
MGSGRAAGEGGVYKRTRDGRWVATVELPRRNGRRARKEFTAKTRKDVLAKKKAFERQLEQGLDPSSGRVTVRVFLDTWINDVIEPSDRAASTKKQYRNEVTRHISPYLGDIRLDRLGPQDVQRWVNDLSQSASAHTGKRLGARSVELAHSVLHNALGQAERWNLVLRNVAKAVEVPRPRVNQDRVHDLSDDHLVRLVEAAKGTDMHAFVMMGAVLGMRRGEMLGLTWSRVDLDSDLPHVRVEQQVLAVPEEGVAIQPYPKTRASRRTLPLPDRLVQVLRTHRALQAEKRLATGEGWKDFDLVFPSSRGTPMDPRNMTRKFHKVCDEAGVEHERVHNLRHTVATIGLAQGQNILEVSKLLGHSSTAVTLDIYSHSVPALQREGVERIASILDGVPRHALPGAPSGNAKIGDASAEE